MKKFNKIAIVLVIGGGFASAAVADCPAQVDRSAYLEGIVENLRAAPSELSARQYAAAMWEVWLTAPDGLAQSLLDEGMRLMQVGAHEPARQVLTRLIDYCPEYPEGYNQRAFNAFLDGDLEAALIDLDVAIELQPVHLGALTGKVLTLIRLGRDEEARRVLRGALAINPWLAERALLDEPPGEDI